MSARGGPTFIIAILLVSLSQSNVIGNEDDISGYISKPEKDKQTSIYIDYASKKDFGPFLGYNMQTIGMEYGFDDPKLFEAIKPLKPAYLRFPGGTAGNFYHWKIDGFEDKDFQVKGHTWGRYEVSMLKKQRGGKVGFVKFLELCRKLGAEPVIVFNIYTEDADSSAEFVKYIRELNIVAVKYGMLGCENYAGNQNIVKFSSKGKGRLSENVEEFSGTAEEALNKIKEVDPDINLSVNLITLKSFELAQDEFNLAASLSVNPRRNDYAQSYAREGKGWNNKLIEKKDIFDSFEMHYYTPVGNRQPLYKKNNISEIEMTLYEQWRYILFSQHKIAGYVSEMLKEIYPRSLWSGEGGVRMIDEENRMAAMMCALDDAEYVFLTSDMYPQFTHALRHVLNSGQDWGILSRYNDRVKDDFNQPYPLRYYALKLLGNINECKKRVQCRIENSPQIKGHLFYKDETMPVIDARIFEKDKTLYIYVINRGPEREEINVETGKEFKFPGRIERLGGYLDARVTQIQEDLLSKYEFEVSPFSLTLITVEVKE